VTMMNESRPGPLAAHVLGGVISLSLLVFAAYLTLALIRFPTTQPGASSIAPNAALARQAIVEASTLMRATLSGRVGEISLRSGGTLGDALASRAPRSIALGLSAAFLALVITSTMTFAAMSGRKRRTVVVGVLTIFASMPTFIALLALIALELAAARVSGRTLLPFLGFAYDLHLVLPSLALALRPAASATLLLLEGVDRASTAPHVTAARARGFADDQIMRRHVLPNVLPEAAGPALVALRQIVGGLVIVEFLLAIGGMGAAFITGLRAGDAPLLAAAAVTFGAAFFAIDAGLAALARKATHRERLT
jgi:ABC-type dipeptide/oligopeptide/nickel transport system permease component